MRYFTWYNHKDLVGYLCYAYDDRKIYLRASDETEDIEFTSYYIPEWVKQGKLIEVSGDIVPEVLKERFRNRFADPFLEIDYERFLNSL
jgi:hypothetical protein